AQPEVNAIDGPIAKASTAARATRGSARTVHERPGSRVGRAGDTPRVSISQSGIHASPASAGPANASPSPPRARATGASGAAPAAPIDAPVLSAPRPMPTFASELAPRTACAAAGYAGAAHAASSARSTRRPAKPLANA